jgi:hypothetical protein
MADTKETMSAGKLLKIERLSTLQSSSANMPMTAEIPVDSRPMA